LLSHSGHSSLLFYLATRCSRLSRPSRTPQSRNAHSEWSGLRPRGSPVILRTSRVRQKFCNWTCRFTQVTEPSLSNSLKLRRPRTDSYWTLVQYGFSPQIHKNPLGIPATGALVPGPRLFLQRDHVLRAMKLQNSPRQLDGHLPLCNKSCFILTPQGATWAREFVARAAKKNQETPGSPPTPFS
jgi:hypothetical protein